MTLETILKKSIILLMIQNITVVFIVKEFNQQPPIFSLLVVQYKY